VPAKQALRRQRLGILLSGIQHHLHHAFNVAAGFHFTAKIQSQPAGDGRTHLSRIQPLTFDGARLGDIGGQMGQARLGAEAESEPLHPSQQAPLPMPDLRQQR